LANGVGFYPKYIQREEERQIWQQLDAVRQDRRSRAVLLYGPGGVGKTSLVRQMAASGSDELITWLDPIDADDPEYWLLSNLEQKVAHKLDPSNRYFGPYREQLSRLPSYTRTDITHETIVSYLGRIKDIFSQCYENFVNAEGKTVVIVFDTIETIRGTNLLLTLTQWIKALPTATLFILSGRPLPDLAEASPGPVRAELESPYQGVPVTTVKVGSFTIGDAREFLRQSGVADDLLGDEEDKLVLLSRGHPLWLAFVVDYLRTVGLPEEVELNTLHSIEEHIPYGLPMTLDGRKLHEAFLGRLVAPYRDSDFWHEAIKRLAVVRQPIAESVWQRLMSDYPLPDDAPTLDAAWERLLATPWVRPRGNKRYVTLHDAVAEEFAQRLFPLQDQDEQWRHAIWRRALEIYSDLASEADRRLGPQFAALDDDLKRVDVLQRNGPVDGAPSESELIEYSAVLDARRREVDQLRAASVYYLFLNDFERGCNELLTLFKEAEQENDVFLQDLFVLYLQRFLPGGTSSSAFNDVIRAKLDGFREWLVQIRPDYYLAIGIMVAKYLIDSTQPESALRLLDELPPETAEASLRHRINILRGNAYMRIPDAVRDGLPYFRQALEEAESLETVDRYKLVAEAYKELGFYYRNTGQWQDADQAYQSARDIISATLSLDSSAEERDEMASIQTNWAYVKGLNGNYREGSELAETAIGVRRRIGIGSAQGISWSVCGEVYRYARRFEKAWAAYDAAEQLLPGSRYWSWQGLIYQQKAICLHQALQDGIRLTAYPAEDAKTLIKRALDVCLSHSIRGYPSALNRAGRIFAEDDPEEALRYLRMGIDEAWRLADGWFWFANLLEYAELSYSCWAESGQSRHRQNIDDVADRIRLASEQFEFPDLSGRWSLLQGHLAIHDYLMTRDAGILTEALDRYERGFADVAQRHVGSSGAASIPAEFRKFGQLFTQLPRPIQADWQVRLRAAWSELKDGSTLLLARLEDLY
jgi:tetratricopeptide (TPR) repeat protein